MKKLLFLNIFEVPVDDLEKFIVTLEDNIYTENENDNLPSTHISILYT